MHATKTNLVDELLELFFEFQNSVAGVCLDEVSDLLALHPDVHRGDGHLPPPPRLVDPPARSRNSLAGCPRPRPRPRGGCPASHITSQKKEEEKKRGMSVFGRKMSVHRRNPTSISSRAFFAETEEAGDRAKRPGDEAPAREGRGQRSAPCSRRCTAAAILTPRSSAAAASSRRTATSVSSGCGEPRAKKKRDRERDDPPFASFQS